MSGFVKVELFISKAFPCFLFTHLHMLYSAQWHRVQRNVRMVQLCALQQMQKNI